ncbi:hypothetical protein EWM64_g8576 [Hericium alpestre]|uniref:Growth hormone-inducible transmembrane protein n=1 Tax=Hericium alpestre TaxID=135208 RepID=A0A4Y9ZKU5_9AGAM|nr:hypothetical protein EWM64_g8576 [Hericium alpestre]
MVGPRWWRISCWKEFIYNADPPTRSYHNDMNPTYPTQVGIQSGLPCCDIGVSPADADMEHVELVSMLRPLLTEIETSNIRVLDVGGGAFQIECTNWLELFASFTALEDLTLRCMVGFDFLEAFGLDLTLNLGTRSATGPADIPQILFPSLRRLTFFSNVLDALRRRPNTFSSGFFKSSQSSRTIMDDAVVTRPPQQEAWRRYAIAAATVAGTVIGTQAWLNRDTRDALSDAERQYLNDSFKYTGAGLVLTALAARTMFRAGLPFRIMAANPWVVLGVSLAGGIGSMMGVFYTPPEKTVQKHLFWLAFNACQAATLSPLFFLSPALLSRAALYTCGVVGALSYVGATARNDKYLYMGGPLLAGVTVVALSSLAPMALPLGLRGLAVSEAISLYGGLAVFGGFVLYDTQKILRNARLAEHGQLTRDPMREAIGLELDMINIFIRLVQILAMQNKNKHK